VGISESRDGSVAYASIALFKQLGPGLVTGATMIPAASHPLAGGRAPGYGLALDADTTYPLMTAMLWSGAHIGRARGKMDWPRTWAH